MSSISVGSVTVCFRSKLLTVALLLAAGSWPAAIVHAQLQPTGAAAFHRSGQTFFTWTERADLSGEQYRIYRHTAPITAANVAQATALGTVPEGSSTYHIERCRADAYPPETNGGYTSLRNYVIQPLGSQLGDDTGLFVWTTSASGTLYYAITTIFESNENTSDFTSENTVGPLTEAVAAPEPVLVWQSTSGRGRVYTQFMDRSRWNPTFETPACDLGHSYRSTYAYNYFVGLPSTDQCGGALPAEYALLLHIEGYGSRYEAEDGAHYYCAVELWGDDPRQSWYYGYSATHDYSVPDVAVTTGPIVNFTEERVLRAVYDTLRGGVAALDDNRIYAYGHSMGGSGSLAFGMRYPNVFAAVYCSEPMTDYANSSVGAADPWLTGDLEPRWGALAANLPIENRGVYAAHLAQYDGTGVFDWQDHQAQLVSRAGDEMAHISLVHGLQDTVIAWASQGSPAYAPFYDGRRAFSGEIVDADHTWLGYAGLGPTVGDSGGGPFFGMTVLRDETIPGLSDASGSLAVPPPGVGGYNMNLEWSASWNVWDTAPTDTATDWAISLRTTDSSNQTVDVTPRRTQSFTVAPGAAVDWANRRVSDGGLVASGTVVADADGLVTVADVAVSPAGNRLSLQLGGGAATATPTPSPTGTVSPPATASATATATATDTATPEPTDGPRPLPDTTFGIHVFNDQLSNLNPQLAAFSASRYDGTQKMRRVDADLLRGSNPNFVILHYRLGLGLGYQFVDESCQPNGTYLGIIDGDWVQEWPGDDVVQDEWFFQWESRRVLHCAWGWYLMDLDNASWRAWWVPQVLSQLEHNDADGLFADSFSVPSYLGGDQYDPDLPALDPTFEAAWTARIEAFIAHVQNAFAGRYYFIPNVGDWVNSRDAVDYSGADGVMIEGFGFDVWANYGGVDWALQMDRALGLINLDRAVIGQSYYNDAVNGRLFSVGSYLLVKGAHTYLNLEWGEDPEWWPEYGIPIGAPAGPAPAQIADLFDAGQQVYMRSYGNGLAVVNAGDSAQTVALGGTYYQAQPAGGGTVPPDGVLPAEWTVSYEPVTEVTLAAGSGAVLLLDPNPPTPTPTSSPTPTSTPTVANPVPVVEQPAAGVALAAVLGALVLALQARGYRRRRNGVERR
ncbi:MAG: hypothetical protein HYV63_24410 [Candidatus Schekmanbacteria bacterium]|nr:hypothetical protein [Candidatus Schekmanbacteria bacterium]